MWTNNLARWGLVLICFFVLFLQIWPASALWFSLNPPPDIWTINWAQFGLPKCQGAVVHCQPLTNQCSAKHSIHLAETALLKKALLAHHIYFLCVSEHGVCIAAQFIRALVAAAHMAALTAGIIREKATGLWHTGTSLLILMCRMHQKETVQGYSHRAALDVG